MIPINQQLSSHLHVVDAVLLCLFCLLILMICKLRHISICTMFKSDLAHNAVFWPFASLDQELRSSARSLLVCFVLEAKCQFKHEVISSQYRIPACCSSGTCCWPLIMLPRWMLMPWALDTMTHRVTVYKGPNLSCCYWCGAS